MIRLWSVYWKMARKKMIGEGRSHCPLTVYKIVIFLFFLAIRILDLGTLFMFQRRWAQIHGMNTDWPKPVVLSEGIDFVPQGTFNNIWRYFWLPQLGENCYWHLTGEARDATQQHATVVNSSALPLQRNPSPKAKGEKHCCKVITLVVPNSLSGIGWVMGVWCKSI